MPIQVTCPSCFKRFQVSDKFAGKSGPCPNCKKTIKVPEKSEEVVIHAPRDDSPKDRTGRSVLKPLKRKETDITRRGMLITAGAILAVIVAAIVIRMMGDDQGAPLWSRIAGAVLLAPPLVWAGYTFVRDSELAPYEGAELRNRVLILSAIFAALWLIYAFLPSYLLDLASAAEMSFIWFGIVFCLMLAIGAFASVATFELEFASGLAHAGLYLIASLLLGLLAGITFAGKEPSGPLDELLQGTTYETVTPRPIAGRRAGGEGQLARERIESRVDQARRRDRWISTIRCQLHHLPVANRSGKRVPTHQGCAVCLTRPTTKLHNYDVA